MQHQNIEVEKNTPIEEIVKLYRREGVVVIRDFYDVGCEISPILENIRHIIEFVAKRYNILADCSTAEAAMSEGYKAIIRSDRQIGGEIYDAVKQIPAFIRLVSNSRNADLYRQLQDDCIPGLAAGGYGIRIDNPGEEKFRAQWHQEFPAQLRSLDGVVFWSPLIDVAKDMGPVQVLLGSHAEGFLDVLENDGGAGKSGAYALFLRREKEVIDSYSCAAPLLNVGDLLIMNFLTVHQSGYNVSSRSRWSMQYRYFNFADPVGRSIAWRGSFAAGVDFKATIKELSGT